MLGFPQLDIGDLDAANHGWKNILVAANGANGSDPVQLKFPPDTPFQNFLDWSGPKVNVTPARRAFTESGDEIQDFDQLLDDDVVYISRGEDFCKGGVDKTADGEIVAIKLINKRSFNEITDADRVFVEIQALRDLSHKHVIKMKDVVDNPKYICFIMEYATNGELRNYVSKKTRLKEDEARQFFEQIIKGVHYCHSKNIVHRDLKLENILLDEGNQCKIADFGLSHFVVDSHATVTEGGTQAYLAPEVWNGQSKHSSPFQLDVWALGVILFGMTHGRLPFERPDRHTLERLRTVLSQDSSPSCTFSSSKHSVACPSAADLVACCLPFDASASPALKRTINAMLHPDPRKRIRISDLMNDAWLRQSLPWEDAQETLQRDLSGNCSSECGMFVPCLRCIPVSSNSPAKVDSSNPSRSPSQDGGPSSEAVPPAGTTIDDAMHVNRSVLRSWETLSQGTAPTSSSGASPKDSSAPAVKRPSRTRAPESLQSSSVPSNRGRAQMTVESNTLRVHSGAVTVIPPSAHSPGAPPTSSTRLSGGTVAGRKKLGSQGGSANGSALNFAPLPSGNAAGSHSSATGARRRSPSVGGSARSPRGSRNR
ncbi:putative CAM kinase, SNF1/AMK1 family ToxPK1 [Neospora caninum Liverpool]|uniref:Putative CAM kinase, SNF1/AMK1 family ToxPK1 n=1 Tax=Neospora caninum (strain Liverpool) TaxID=572307 RepID=F0VE89_NEOCL|nr:putative CAM kinase, SNF1/AMK1 family ToxPK1 [Neospora caninum Liverpool]CBZ52033.1 putative CAM kinase, SNF1/AMK1 family ToxPK1 [Neospora caninum Liverpool]|eukprot:XP_003882065.1 putative CAM kinase, SNF1/AMK1 family ToxPK1 [Neospora caninum Liverpool]